LDERRALSRLAMRLKRTESDTIRWLVIEASAELYQSPEPNRTSEPRLPVPTKEAEPP